MYDATETFIDLDFEQRVRRLAYDLSEQDGRQIGREMEYRPP